MFRTFLFFALPVCAAATAIGQTFPLADTAPHPLSESFGSAARYQPPTGADLETEPNQLTKEEFQALKEQLKQDPKMDQPKTYGAPGAVGGLFDSLDFKRRAGHHPMIEYIKQIERFESKEVGR